MSRQTRLKAIAVRRKFVSRSDAAYNRPMPTLTIALPPREDQTAFNLRRWTELCSDTELARALAKIEGRVESDRHGRVILSPVSSFTHGSLQSRIAGLLGDGLPNRRIVIACPISTADGVRAADVAWISRARLAKIGENVCLTKAPEICVEVLSPDNTRLEMRDKKALYFAAGAREVWFCDGKGKMTFFRGATSAGERASTFCPQFPGLVQV